MSYVTKTLTPSTPCFLQKQTLKYSLCIKQKQYLNILKKNQAKSVRCWCSQLICDGSLALLSVLCFDFLRSPSTTWTKAGRTGSSSAPQLEALLCLAESCCLCAISGNTGVLWRVWDTQELHIPPIQRREASFLYGYQILLWQQTLEWLG